MFKKFLHLLFILVLCFFIVAPVSAATSFSLSPAKVYAEKGKVFSLKLRIDPKGVKNYTVKISVKFSPKTVKLLTWKYADNWMPIRKGGYDSFDNEKGTLIRSAGYPEGFSGPVTFATLSFYAKESGTGIIEFAGEELALDENSKNVYGGGNKVTVFVEEMVEKEIITPSTTTPSMEPEVTPVIIPEEQKPEEKVPEIKAPEVTTSTEATTTPEPNIKLNLNDRQFVSAKNLSIAASLSNFGTSSVPVDLLFSILNAEGKSVYTSRDSVDVLNSTIFNQQFSDLDLAPGSYSVRLTALYNNTSKEVASDYFEILSQPQPAKGLQAKRIALWGLLLLLVAVLIYLIIFLSNRSKNSNPQKKVN